MASIISSGIGSGLDVAGIVQQLVTAERAPVESRIGQREARVQSQISAFGSLKSALSEFRDLLETMKDLNTFLTRKATSSNEDVFTVTVDETALPGNYDIEVEQLAQAQKLTSGAFADADAVVGTGTLQISVGTESFSLEITTENNTLSGIRDAINEAVDNTGVAATIVNADAGSMLILTGEYSGSSNNIVVTQSGGDGGLSALEYDPDNGLNSLTESIAAQDAVVRIDGFEIVGENNSFNGAMQGATLTLHSAAPGVTESLTIENDTDAVQETVNKFVESYNNLVTTFDQLTSFDAETSIAGPMVGDATVRSIRDQIRREMSAAINDPDAPFGTLTEVGVESQLDGKLAVVDDNLSQVLAEDFTQFGMLFTRNDGYAVRLFDLVDGFLATDGIIETRTTGLDGSLERLSDQRDSLDERMVSLETRLMRQFNALDSLISRLTTTSNFLTEQLATLPGFTRPDQT